jgi:hypothetical protein
MSQTVQRKQASYDAVTVRALKADPTRGMFWALMATLGASLAALLEIWAQMMAEHALGPLAMCLAASMQIRANVVVIGNDVFGMAARWPLLVIKGERVGLADTWNFGALRVVGHIMLLFAARGDDVAGKRLANAFLNKAGDCVLNSNPVGSIAGRINTEIAASWSSSDKSELATLLATEFGECNQASKILASAPSFSKEFAHLVQNELAHLHEATWELAQQGERVGAALEDA